jgi:RimJ/RimL family protein N-acetyltransferase
MPMRVMRGVYNTHAMVVRLLTAADAAAFRAQRIRALREHPEAFGRAPEEVDSVEVWTERLRAFGLSDLDFLLGAFDADALVGTVGCHRDHGAKQRHIAYVWGMYVVREQCGKGLGRRLLLAALDHIHTWPDVEQVWLDVTPGNTGARALYASCGFTSIAVKPRVLKVGDHYHDEELMALSLKPS